jgi:hypothetical protein
MTDFISAGSKLACPACHHLQLFERSIPEDSLPIFIRCSHCDWRLSFAKGDTKPVFAKVDPINRVHGNWTVEMQQAAGKDYWKESTSSESFRDGCNGIASHLAGGLQLIERLRGQLRQLADNMTEQFQGEWGMHSAFLRYWNPTRVESWIKQPFCAFPVKCEDKWLTARTRLFIQPSFFTPIVGFPLRSYGGFYAQLITPYLLIEFPLETWLRNILDVTATPELKVVADRIVGRDLFHCWRDIPGTVPAEDHHDDAPILKISNSLQARTWLARLSVSPWLIGKLTEDHAFKQLWTYFESQTTNRKLYGEVFKQFVEYGRMALFFADIKNAWEVSLTIGSFMYGQKLVLIPSPERKDQYQALHREAAFVKANTSFHWKVVNQSDSLDDVLWDTVGYVIVDYSEDFPPEALEKLYNYNGRLIIISQNPVMDTLTSNWEASRFYGLVAKSIWHPEIAGIESPFSYEKGQDGLVQSILSDWHEGSKISTGKL